MDSYSSALCLVTYSTGISCKFSTLQKMLVSKEYTASYHVSFHRHCINQSSGRNNSATFIYALEKSGFCEAHTLVSEKSPATFCHLSCAFLSCFLEPVDEGVPTVSGSNPT